MKHRALPLTPEQKQEIKTFYAALRKEGMPAGMVRRKAAYLRKLLQENGSHKR